MLLSFKSIQLNNEPMTLIVGDRPGCVQDGGGPQRAGDYSPETAREIDSEVRRLLEEQHERATAVLGAKKELLRQAAKILLEKETLTGEELQTIATAYAALPTSDQGSPTSAPSSDFGPREPLEGRCREPSGTPAPLG